MRVFTFYEPLLDEQEALIELWAKSWRNHGWDPVVLDRASANPGSDRFLAAYKQLPSVNPGNYDAWCYLRWVAMERVGGGTLTDYDVMNYGYTPEMLMRSVQHWTEPLIVLGGHVPAMVYGTRMGYRGAAWDFLSARIPDVCEHVNGHLHCSDMLILAKGGVMNWKSVNLLKEFGEPGWETADLVHFAGARVGQQAKHRVIQRERPV